MKLIRFEDDLGRVHSGILRGDGEAVLLGANQSIEDIEEAEPVAAAKLLAPVAPVNIFAIGLNYGRHAEETGAALPMHPVVFMKPTTAVCNPRDPIVIPACTTHGPEVDYEGELAMVVGREARNVSVEDALQYLLGFTCANDVSARRWQKVAGGGQFVRGKGFDSFCPLGPTMVTLEEIGDPQNLSIKTYLNGKLMQDSNTSDMIHSAAQLLSFLSQDTTISPGTVILTGTPEGVGFARDPQVFLMPGDEVTVEIEKIGRLTNPVVAAEQ